MATGSVAIILTTSAGFEFVVDARMIMLTGAEVLDKPLLLVATAVGAKTPAGALLHV